jgi:hypothetical protein
MFISPVLISVSRKASPMSGELLIKVITWVPIKNVEFVSKQQDTDIVTLRRQREISYRIRVFSAYINYSTELKFRYDYKF